MPGRSPPSDARTTDSLRRFCLRARKEAETKSPHSYSRLSASAGISWWLYNKPQTYTGTHTYTNPCTHARTLATARLWSVFRRKKTDATQCQCLRVTPKDTEETVKESERRNKRATERNRDRHRERQSQRDILRDRQTCSHRHRQRDPEEETSTVEEGE